MENKKYLPLKIGHLILIVAGIALYVVTLFCFNQGSTALMKTSTVLNIVALVAGFVYLSMGYKKNAAVYYKTFMWILVVAEIIENTAIFSMGTSSVSNTLEVILALVLFVLLAGAKDYGKTKSNIIAIALVAINVYAVISLFSMLDQFGAMAMGVMFDQIGQLILASTTALMVCGKYIDKTARGTK